MDAQYYLLISEKKKMFKTVAAAFLAAQGVRASSIRSAVNTGPQVDSRLASGESSFVTFPSELDRHVENLSLKKRGKGVSVSPDSAVVESSRDAFLDTYAGQLGVKKEHLRRSRSIEEAGSGLTFHHYQQYVLGHKVFGGEVVVVTGSHGEVVEGHGHPLQVSDIVDFYADATFSSNTDAVKSAITSKISEVSQSSSASSVRCDEEAWSLETSWYRDSLMRSGTTGDVSLVVHAGGVCYTDKNMPVAFDAFGNDLVLVDGGVIV